MEVLTPLGTYLLHLPRSALLLLLVGLPPPPDWQPETTVTELESLSVLFLALQV